MEYARWKEDCRQMFPVVGSGRFITAPVISEDGQPIQDPLVLSQMNPDKGADGNRANGIEPVTDKKVIQWMLTLHQIGL